MSLVVVATLQYECLCAALLLCCQLQASLRQAICQASVQTAEVAACDYSFGTQSRCGLLDTKSFAYAWHGLDPQFVQTLVVQMNWVTR